jgi:hypothetical protein
LFGKSGGEKVLQVGYRRQTLGLERKREGDDVGPVADAEEGVAKLVGGNPRVGWFLGLRGGECEDLFCDGDEKLLLAGDVPVQSARGHSEVSGQPTH